MSWYTIIDFNVNYFYVCSDLYDCFEICSRLGPRTRSSVQIGADRLKGEENEAPTRVSLKAAALGGSLLDESEATALKASILFALFIAAWV